MAERSEWRPNKKQEIFLAVPWTIKEAFYGGGAGSGKSDVLLVYGLVHRLHENPKFKQVFQRRTYPELKNEIVPRSRELYAKFGATLNRSDMVWTFPRPDQYGGTGGSNAGAMIFLGHCENEDDVHKYDSMEINLYTPDELTSFTEYIYLYIGYTRVRTSDPSLPAIIRSAGMPGGIGHTFVKRRFVDPAPEGNKIIVGRGGNKRIYVHSTLADNPHIDPNYAQGLDALHDAERKAKKFGDWSAYLGQVFNEFRDRQYPDEPENALHVVEPFDIPNWWPKIVVGDWGFAAMTYIMYGAISPQKRLYIYREQSFVKTKIEEWAPFVREFIDKEKPRTVKFCQSAKADRGQEHTIQEQIAAALGRSIDLTGNAAGSRVAGKILVHEYLRWNKKHTPQAETPTYSEEHAMWLLRNKGLEDYKAYLSLFNAAPLEEENLPKLQIFNNCPLLVDAIKACSYDKPKDNKPAEDVAEFSGDDPYDTLRYMCDAADRYFDEAAREFKNVQKQEELINRLQVTNNWTPFYRQMRQLENSSAQKPIRRFHR
jgi:hypothetical protein